MSLFSSASISLRLTLSSKVGFGVDSVFVDGVDVVFRRLQRSELRAQVTVLAAVGTSGAWLTQGIWRLGILTDGQIGGGTDNYIISCILLKCI